MGAIASKHNQLPALQTVTNCVTESMMGPWFVIAVKPTMFETTNSNAVERYIWNKDKKEGSNDHDFDIDFQFNADAPLTSKLKALPQKGWIDDENTAVVDKEKRQSTKTGNWKVSPMWPIKMPYLIIEADTKHYQYAVVGYPSRAYCWILGRKPQMDDTLYKDLLQRLREKHQYDLTGLRRVPQKWTKAERKKRELTDQEIPDSMLEKE